MAGLQSGAGRMMIDSVIWAQHINVTDRHTDSHVAIANTAPMHWRRAAEMKRHPTKTVHSDKTKLKGTDSFQYIPKLCPEVAPSVECI